MGPFAAISAYLAASLGGYGQIAPPLPPPIMPLPTTAGTYDPVVAQTIHEAEDDIDRRRDDGELTKAEARRLDREAGRVHDLAEFYAADGRLSESERRDLQFHAMVVADRAELPRPR
jgi:hypothetical protein